MASASARPRRRTGLSGALVLVLWLTGCGPGADRPMLRAADVERSMESATGLALKRVAPPTGVPGLPELATTLSGASADESLTIFVFFEADGVKRVLGKGRRPAGMNVLTRSNVVVLYRTSREAGDRSRQVRQALETVIPDS